MAEPEEPVEETASAGQDMDSAEMSPVLVFLDPELGSEAREAVATSLGCEAWVIDPEDLDPALHLEADRAFVIPMSLGTQSGLDLVEALRRREHGADVAIAVADEQPTRRKVIAALRAGASTFLHRPYDADEVRERLGHVLEARDAADGVEDPSDGVSD